MIQDALAIDLARKIADALENRIGKASRDADAEKDISRIRRLHRNGRLSIHQYASCLNALVDNPALSGSMKTAYQAELDDLDDVINAVVDPSGTEKLLPYDTSRVLVPAAAIERDGNASWHTIEGAAAADFLHNISPVDGAIRTSQASTICQMRPLPWYDSVQLVRVFDPRWSIAGLVLYYLTFGGSLFRLNGVSPPLHEVNARAPIKLTKDNVLDYLRFFCFFVRGEQGPFYVLETQDDPFLCSMNLSPEVEGILASHARPVELIEQDKEGNFHCQLVVFYSNAVFRADMKVQPTGMIEMLQDEPVAEGLPARISAPISYSDKA